MATITERETGAGVRYDVRYRDPDGRQRKRTFKKVTQARQFVSTVEADMLRGTYVDPRAGQKTFRPYADEWLEMQTFDPSTREAVATRLRTHVYPVLGSRQLRAIKPSTIQAWLRGLERLAAGHRRVILANVSTILSAAVDDELIAKNPCSAGSVRRPRVAARKVVPWPATRVHAVRDVLPDRWRIVVTLAAGLGLRQGEVFGLSPDDVNFLRGEVEVCRQVKLLGGRQVFALPKGGKVRTVPLPASVKEPLAAYLAGFPARPVTLPWDDLDGRPETVRLVVTTRESTAANRNYFNTHVWKPALAVTAVEPSRENGCHALRHFYASVLLDGGESIKAVSEYLGHSDPGFTLRVYTHLMPSSAERTRKAVDAVLAAGPDGTFMAHRDENRREPTGTGEA
jgi:integrase